MKKTPPNMQTIFAIRMPEALKRRIKRAAKKAQITPGEWARRVLDRAGRK